MTNEFRQKLVTVVLSIEEQDLLISLLRVNSHQSGSKKHNPVVNRFLGRFSRLVFNQDRAA